MIFSLVLTLACLSSSFEGSDLGFGEDWDDFEGIEDSVGSEFGLEVGCSGSALDWQQELS